MQIVRPRPFVRESFGIRRAETIALATLPVVGRVRTDFLWQRSPYFLQGFGSGRIETPGIDFILPYWMGPYHGLGFSPLAVSAASGSAPIAPDSIASLYGEGLPDADAQVNVTDVAGTSQQAKVNYSSGEQIISSFLPAFLRGRPKSQCAILHGC